MPGREAMVIGWEEWKALRVAKRANLRAYGEDAPSRRSHGVGKADERLRVAFAGARAPSFDSKDGR